MDESEEHSITNSSKEGKRKAIRHWITGVVQFQWRSADGQWHDALGMTRDIGKAGLFVESESVPPFSSALTLIVSLPAGWNKDIVPRLGGTGYVRHIRQEPSQPSAFGAAAVPHVEMPTYKGKAQESQRRCRDATHLQCLVKQERSDR